MHKKIQNLFLIDGVGAVVSAVFLGVILVALADLVGIPKETLYFLAAVPCLFALYDWFVFYKVSAYKAKHVLWIALGNLSYSILSMILLYKHRDVLTSLGWLYFVVELLILLALVIFQFRTASRL